MKSSTVTYEGETLESLQSQLEYINSALSAKLENWEIKEFTECKKDCEFKIKSILERLEERK